MARRLEDNGDPIGFQSTRNSAHMARTIMLAELERLFSCVQASTAGRSEYMYAILEENCLGKRSGSTRRLDARHLADLYALDPSITLFRALRYYWERDTAGHPFLALLCACARDALLRATAAFVLSIPEGAVLSRTMMEKYIEALEPGRFSKGTRKCTAQNINSTWTKAGHLTGRARKLRVKANPTPCAAAYALLLAYLQGGRGKSLFDSEHVRILDCPRERAAELAEEAARRGWLVFKRIGNVMDVTFPGLLTPEEVEWSREQSR